MFKTSIVYPLNINHLYSSHLQNILTPFQQSPKVSPIIGLGLARGLGSHYLKHSGVEEVLQSQFLSHSSLSTILLSLKTCELKRKFICSMHIQHIMMREE